MAWADSWSAWEKERVIMKVKTKERENAGDGQIDMMTTRTMKGIKVKERKHVHEDNNPYT